MNQEGHKDGCRFDPNFGNTGTTEVAASATKSSATVVATEDEGATKPSSKQFKLAKALAAVMDGSDTDGED